MLSKLTFMAVVLLSAIFSLHITSTITCDTKVCVKLLLPPTQNSTSQICDEAEKIGRRLICHHCFTQEEYKHAESLLEGLSKKKPNDPEVYRLLGQVKYELKDYDGSVDAYKNSAKVSKTTDFRVLCGVTDALLAAKRHDEAVRIVLDSRESVVNELSKGSESIEYGNIEEGDLIQIDLLLGKVYTDWGHVSDAVSLYDQLIANHPTDFNGYLAKGIILKQNGNSDEAERMFVQARQFAPDEAKALVEFFINLDLGMG